MKLDKQIQDLKKKYSDLSQKLMNSENLDNKKIIQLNKDLSKLEPIIDLTNSIEKLKGDGYLNLSLNIESILIAWDIVLTFNGFNHPGIGFPLPVNEPPAILL